MDKKWDKLWINANIATYDENNCYLEIKQAAIATHQDRIAWLGSMSDLPHQAAQQWQDCQNAWITPGLIDCHTHCIYAGDRINEFTARLQGKSYAEIAAEGGGIKSTVQATRQATEQELIKTSQKRLLQMLSQGVTTIEIKSGYGLDSDTELKILKVARYLGKKLPLTIKTSFLGAHVCPAEYQSADEYIEYICEKVLPLAHQEQLLDAVDGFCEKIAFNPQQIQRVFAKAQHFSLPVKLHAEQLSACGGVELAVNYHALSVDHLEYLTEKSAKALAHSETVAVLLPGAYYFLQESKKPPIDLLKKYNIPFAIATDCNPGSSPVNSLLMMMNMACVLFGLTPKESFQAVTTHAAKALGLQQTHGRLIPGYQADFVLWDIPHPDALSYYIGYNPCIEVIKKGERSYSNE